VKLQTGDTVYVFSDGYVDQYGGTQRKKFKTQKFKELLLSVQAESMESKNRSLKRPLKTGEAISNRSTMFACGRV
jgi:serine phosphatase RsbU (regulator of sigma subunit)